MKVAAIICIKKEYSVIIVDVPDDINVNDKIYIQQALEKSLDSPDQLIEITMSVETMVYDREAAGRKVPAKGDHG